MAKTATIAFQLKCTKCGNLNYTTSKNANENKEKIEIMKFCKNPDCQTRTPHKETKISKAKK